MLYAFSSFFFWNEKKKKSKKQNNKKLLVAFIDNTKLIGKFLCVSLLMIEFEIQQAFRSIWRITED